MRYVPAQCLKPGMLVGKNLYGRKGQKLITKDHTLTAQYIRRIKELGLSGAYICDDVSHDVKIINLIDETLRQSAISNVRDIFSAAQKGKMKPIDVKKTEPLLNSIIDQLLYNEKLIVNMIDLKVFDDYTYSHSVNVAILSIIIGIAYKLDRKELYKLGLGALLHDIGKVFVPKEIVNKPSNLTSEEFEQMKEHSLKGYEYIKESLEIPAASCIVTLSHHEKYNGTGYPNNKKGKEISLHGRIVSIADVYDAFTSNRPYRKAREPFEAIEYIMGNTGESFDPELVNIFVRKIAPYPVGTCVNLSNGMIAIVIENNKHNCLRPKVRTINQTKEQVYDLYNDRSLFDITITGMANI